MYNYLETHFTGFSVTAMLILTRRKVEGLEQAAGQHLHDSWIGNSCLSSTNTTRWLSNLDADYMQQNANTHPNTYTRQKVN